MCISLPPSPRCLSLSKCNKESKNQQLCPRMPIFFNSSQNSWIRATDSSVDQDYPSTRDKLPDRASWRRSSRTRSWRRKATSARPSTKQRGSFRARTLAVDWRLHRSCQRFLARWPPWTDRRRARGGDDSARASARTGPPFSVLQLHRLWRVVSCSFWGGKERA